MLLSARRALFFAACLPAATATATATAATACTPLRNGLVLSKYYLKDCAACRLMTPVVDDLRSQLARAPVPVEVRAVECTSCECPGVARFPTLSLTRDKAPAGTLVGYKDIAATRRWLASLGVDLPDTTDEANEADAADAVDAAEPGQVTALTARNFLSGFDGQWLVLFYKSTSDPLRRVFQRVATALADDPRLRFGEISSHEAASVTNRFNIREFPHIIGFNHGTAVPFARAHTVAALRAFAERLAKPSFESLTYAELRTRAAALRRGEPLFIVLYRDYELASHYYNDLAQQFKFRVPIYKSDDPALFQAAGIAPEEMPEGATHTFETHSRMVRLVVYKNGAFFPAPASLERGSDIIQWIFHAHFPHITQIDNENYHSVFHGIKPILLLFHRDEAFVPTLDRLSSDMHLGAPFANLLFATLDAAEYPLFAREVLPRVQVPALLMHDPITGAWFHEPAVLTADNFEKTARGVIEKYFAGRLPAYPPVARRMRYYVLGLWVLGVVAFFCLRAPALRRLKRE